MWDMNEETRSRFYGDGPPELLFGQSFAEYRAIPALNQSTLKAFSDDAWAFHQREILGNAPPEAETDAMRAGTLIHTAVLEPHLLDEEYAAFDGSDRRTKAWREFAEEAEAAGKIPTLKKDIDSALRLSDSVRQNATIAALLEEGHSEVTALATCPQTGLRLKGRFDWLTPGGCIVDLKTTADVDEWAWQRSAKKFRYGVQDSFYRELAQLNGIKNPDFVFLVVERNPPYRRRLYSFDHFTTSKESIFFYDLCYDFDRALKEDLWPDPADQIKLITL